VASQSDAQIQVAYRLRRKQNLPQLEEFRLAANQALPCGHNPKLDARTNRVKRVEVSWRLFRQC
jgi:hypothetical protein